MEKIKVRSVSLGTPTAFGMGGDFSSLVTTWTVEDAHAAHAAMEEFLRERFEVVGDPHNETEVAK